MVEDRCRLGLLEESLLRRIVVGQIGRQDFDRHLGTGPEPRMNTHRELLQGSMLLLSVVLVLSPRATGAGQDAQTLDQVLVRGAAFVETFVEELSTVVMEEEYAQVYFRSGGNTAARTTLVSEFLLLQVEDSSAWMGFRDVFRVNGRQLRDRQDRLVSLFQGDDTVSAIDQARRIAQESSRYNLGPTRTFNVPTLALFYLHPSRVARSDFTKRNEGCADVETAWDIGFEERQSPTMVRGFEDIDLPARGRFCVEPHSGRVLEVVLELHHPSVDARRQASDARAEVRFGIEPRLSLWVPDGDARALQRAGWRGGHQCGQVQRVSPVQRHGDRVPASPEEGRGTALST